MKTEWHISKEVNINCPMDMVYQGEAGNLFANRIDLKRFNSNGREVILLIDGYVIPRLEYFEKLKSYHNELLIFHLFEKYGSIRVSQRV